MASCMKRLAEEINKRIHFNTDLPFTAEFIALLNILEKEEKILLNKYFCSLDWNIGSIYVLAILQSCKIISASEYLLSQDDEEHVQLVLNDLLESKFELLANITTSCYYDFINATKLTAIFEECFKRLFRDLSENHDSFNTNYFLELKKFKLHDEIDKMLSEINVNVLFHENRSILKNALGHLHVWREAVSPESFLYRLLCEIVNDRQQMLQYIFQKSLEPEFQGWNYYMILLQIIAKKITSTDAPSIKKHLKELFKLCLREKDEKFFYIMLFTARVVFNVQNTNIETYQQWFKTTIGEMSYVVNPQEFKYIMTILTESLRVESNSFFLEIQTNTAISAPPLCNQVVLNYKKLCRRRLAALNKADLQHSFDLDESIIID